VSQNPIIDDLLDIINQVQWPMAHRANAEARRMYEDGLDQVNASFGNPAGYVKALKLFHVTRSAAYAAAGVAFTLVMSSTFHGRPPRGFDEAAQWLEKAQEWEPNRVEINFVEAVLYLNSGQLENGRLILDYLGQQEPDNYYLCLTELNYWAQKQDNDRAGRWLGKAMDRADNRLRRAYTLHSLAGSLANPAEEVALWHKIADLNPEDFLAWHKLSLIYLQQKKLKEAEVCNQRALALADFDAGREVEKRIKQQRSGLGRIFGR
jgi:tetratricopeptide (TPR) repeat protein